MKRYKKPFFQPKKFMKSDRTLHEPVFQTIFYCGIIFFRN